jgi:hypothetical protein
MLRRSSANFVRAFGKRNVHVEARLKEIGIELPTPAEPKGNYLPWVKSGNMVFLAGIKI